MLILETSEFSRQYLFGSLQPVDHNRSSNFFNIILLILIVMYIININIFNINCSFVLLEIRKNFGT